MRKFLLLLIQIPCWVILCFFILESLAGLYFVVSGTLTRKNTEIAERQHARFDPELGWVHTPGFSDDNFYGPRRSLNISAEGFRVNPADPSVIQASKKCEQGSQLCDSTSAQVAICSGDSFTLGYGVADQATWCAKLGEQSQARLRTINMGQGGYGIDQAYLWYARDGESIAHDLHLFAVITHDFRRMEQSSFLGYAKPQIAFSEMGVPYSLNTPLTDSSVKAKRVSFAIALLQELQNLHLLKFIRGVTQNSVAERLGPENPETRELALQLFDYLHSAHITAGRKFTLIYLPTPFDILPNRATDDLRTFYAAELSARGIPFCDLVEPIRTLAEEIARSLYIQPGEVSFSQAEHHFNEKGNEWVATELISCLKLFESENKKSL